MALGTLGSTLNDELNRLANGGTYRDMNQMVDEALAAKQWANRENINPYSTDTVGILNEIAGLGLDKKNWLDFNGVCNYIAGTTGLPAAAALRQVYPTTDLLTGVASYYVDATAPTNWGSLGYVYLNGVAGNYMQTPDASALDITGDLDLRVYVAADNWTAGTNRPLIAKTTGLGNFSYLFRITTTNALNFIWTSDGTNNNATTSTSNPVIADGQPLWLRVTLDVDNGAGGRDIIFYTSTDGSTWTQLGTTITQASTTSIFNSTAPVELGSYVGGAQYFTGKYYRAQVFAGLTGTDKRLDVNIATDFRASNEDTFTATTGQIVTVNGVDTIANLGAAGSLLPTTLGSSTAADSNDPKFLDFTGTNYVYLPGTASNHISTPDSSALRITGDIDLRAFIALDDWTPAAATDVLMKWETTAQRAYLLRVETTGRLSLIFTTDGATSITVTSTASPTISDGSPLWVRATRVASTGVCQFFTSTNGTTWTQLGTDVTGTSGNIFSGTSDVSIGRSTGTLAGKVFRAQIFNGIDGTKVLDIDTSTLQTGADAYIVPTTYSGAAGAFFTGTGLSLNGVAGNYVSTPDASQLDITGDIDIAVQVALADWTPASTQALLGKRASGQFSYQFIVQTTGVLGFSWTTDGSTSTTVNSTVAPTVADGATLWVRVTMDVNNGASGNTVTFFTSTDGTTWTQLGTPVVTAGTTSLFSGTAPLEVGSVIGGTGAPANGTFYRAVVKSGIDGFPVFDATFVGVPANSLRMIESSTYKAVVTLNTTRYCTINRSTSGRKTVAVTQPTWLFGTDDYMEVNNRYMSSGTYLYLPGVVGNTASAPDSAALDITGDIDLRAKVALDDWTPSANQIIISKADNLARLTYQFNVDTSGKLQFLASNTGSAWITNVLSSVATNITDGATKWVRATFDVDNGASGRDTKFWLSDDGTNWTQLGTTITEAGTTSIINTTSILQIGANLAGASQARGKFFRAQVLNGIDGTVAFDANFETSITSLTQTSFTESSANAATVTINRSGSAYRSAGITTAGYLYPGATNTFAASATDFLNFGASDSFTVVWFGRLWATPVTGRVLIGKAFSGSPFTGWAIMNQAATTQARLSLYDGTTSINAFGFTPVSGALSGLAAVLDRSTQFATVYTNLAAGTRVPLSTLGSLSTIMTLRIPSWSDGLLTQDAEIYAAAVFRQALSVAQIRQITNYFANREVYL